MSHYSTNKKLIKPKCSSLTLPFACAWFIAEVPILINIPESAVRYTSALIAPSALLLSVMYTTAFETIEKKYKKVCALFLMICITGIFLTNISYVFAFRASWGSAFIGEELVSEWILSQHEQNVGVLYYATTAGDEYLVVNKNNNNYCITKDLVYLKTSDVRAYNSEKLEVLAKKHSSLYLVKRVSTKENSKYPPIDFEQNKQVKLAKIIEGRSNTPFDWASSVIMRKLAYYPNKFYIYKYVS